MGLADPAFWQLPPAARLDAFASLRRLDRPAYFVERPATWLRPEQGFYALVTHDDVVRASRLPQVFASAPGVTTPEPAGWVRFLFGDSMVNLDAPHHTQLRRVVSRAFTPRLLAAADEDIRRVAARIVDDMIAERPGEFVASVASRMPFEVICNLMGIPEHYRPEIAGRVDHASENVGVERGIATRLRVPGRGLRALARMHLMMATLGRERRRRPTGDLISALVGADVDGQALDARQLGAFFSLLMVAGVETTRNAITHALALLTDHPEQRALLASDFDRYADGAVDEILRHSTPIIQFRRTVRAEYSLGGRTFRPGDKVVLYYASANRDEAVFPDPDAFDITRSPNPHLGYGGGGPHFCLGAHLARQEIKALFRELLSRPRALRAVGVPELAGSNFDNRVRALRFAFDPPAP
ncbi:cytochrome P450 [Streptomyces sp. NBC_01387]|uniref:cytochrome P450 n=1 Tax=Streptomyces sp. NBC_01500 TaxID=2903886 RepID=UPI0020247DC4|nr:MULTISPECIES: cytochrome P450 [unclassified Streptomyces]MCX4549827.1 cytochrome P450 [Streptomyces sp. NBC_01500]WSC24667.1 cytochrome P450 [Streptomyces sp. NBC_01766]WSV58644.1 cytochrome P450 [Streptomyces sp. NBC_01014]